MQLVAKIRVAVQRRDMSVHVHQTNRRVGHDRVEVVQQITLRHYRQMPHVVGVKRRQVDLLEPVTMPGGSPHRAGRKFLEARRAFIADREAKAKWRT